MKFLKKKKRGMVTLQLTALIDVFSMIIIFLIKGAVLGATSINIPSGLQLPSSASQDSLENAPKIFVYNNKVKIDFLNEEKKIDFFQGGSATSAQQIGLQKRIRKFIQSNAKKQKTSDNMLNFIADKKIQYKHIHSILSFFRETGFQSALFIVQTENQ